MSTPRRPWETTKSSRGEDSAPLDNDWKALRWIFIPKTQLANEKNRERDFVVRQGLQDEVIALCLTFEGLVNALKASAAYPGVNAHKAEVWTRKSMDVRYICAAWRDHERERRSTQP